MAASEGKSLFQQELDAAARRLLENEPILLDAWKNRPMTIGLFNKEYLADPSCPLRKDAAFKTIRPYLARLAGSDPLEYLAEFRAAAEGFIEEWAAEQKAKLSQIAKRPKKVPISKEARDEEMVRRYEELLSKPTMKEKARAEVGAKFGVSAKTVYRVVKENHERKRMISFPRSNQGPLGEPIRQKSKR